MITGTLVCFTLLLSLKSLTDTDFKSGNVDDDDFNQDKKKAEDNRIMEL